MAYSMPDKDPSATLDYVFDFAAETNGSSDPGATNWLQTGETIASFEITAPSGITASGSSLINSNTAVRVWLSGGTAYEEYTVACKVTTNSLPVARVDERSIKIKCMNR